MLQAGNTWLNTVWREDLAPSRGDRAPLPALSTNFIPSSSSAQEIYAFWVQKKAPRGKEKRERERKRMKMILIFFFGVEMKLILKVSKF